MGDICLLLGQACIAFEDSPASKKEIACTRRFGTAITELSDLVESVTEFASRACEKLCKQGGHAGQVLVFINTSPFRREDPQYARSITVPLRRPTSDSGLIASSAVRGVRAIYRPGYRFAKAGLMLLDLQEASIEQGELDLDDVSDDRSKLMDAMDAINDRYGRGALTLASAGTAREARSWVMKQDLKTPAYTTRWTDLPCARA